MTWARLDDKFHGHPKALRAWEREPRAVGLHAMALSWAAMHETDGRVPSEYVVRLLADERERAKAVETLVEVGLWEANGTGWEIHDYLDYNPSKAQLQEKRAADSARKAAQRKGRRSK